MYAVEWDIEIINGFFGEFEFVLDILCDGIEFGWKFGLPVKRLVSS